MTDNTEDRTMTEHGTFTAAERPLSDPDREKLVKMLHTVSEKLFGRITAPRFKTKTTDKDLLAFCRALAAMAVAANTVQKDMDLEALETRIAALEQQKEREKPMRY